MLWDDIKAYESDRQELIAMKEKMLESFGPLGSVLFGVCRTSNKPIEMLTMIFDHYTKKEGDLLSLHACVCGNLPSLLTRYKYTPFLLYICFDCFDDAKNMKGYFKEKAVINTELEARKRWNAFIRQTKSSEF